MTAPSYDQTRLRRTLLVLALMTVFAGLIAVGAHLVLGSLARAQGPYVVNDLGNDPDYEPGDGVCDTDSVADGNPCTLRAAIQEVNASAISDTITIEVTGTIVLTNDLPTIDVFWSDVQIVGPGSGSLTIDGDNLYRLFDVDVYPSSVKIIGLTLANGRATYGGAIYNRGKLRLEDVIITDSTATDSGGAIYNWGDLELYQCTLSNNTAYTDTVTNYGGGIYDTSGSVTMYESTLSGNSADSGGGIYTQSGDVTLDKCTVSDNAATVEGAGIVNYSGDLTLTNSTVSHNIAKGDGGGILVIGTEAGGYAFLNNVTISTNIADASVSDGGDGGGLFNRGGIIDVTNSIIAGNSDPSSVTQHPDCSAISYMGLDPWFPISEYNLVGDNSGCEDFFVDGVAGNQVGDSITPLDPRLGRLADNGGDTLTHALLHDSPARDAGNPATPGSGDGACEGSDQRIMGRPRDGDADGSAVCDIGAYEAGLNNDSWPRALELTLTGDPQQADVYQYIEKLGQSRWYKFQVQPGSQVIIKLPDPPANYDLTLYKDIEAAYLALINPQDEEDLTQLNAEFAPDAYAPDAYAPDAYAPDAYAPDAYAPDAYAPDAYAPDAYAPDAYAPDAYAPDAYAPDAYAPDAYAPDAYAPDAYAPDAYAPDAYAPDEAYTSAQMRSLIAVSAFDGMASESITVNTWDNDGYFYIRVRGRNGVFDTSDPFLLEVTLDVGVCKDVTSSLPASDHIPTGPNFRTIILTDLDRMDATDPLLPTLKTRLDDFALEVDGVVVDVGSDAAVAFANEQADAYPACPYAKNLVAYAIKDIIDGYRALNPGLEYIVIIGNDDVIPFFRHPDRALLANEKNYAPPVFDNTASQASLKLSYVLSQDRYGSRLDLSLSNTSLPIPGLAVGRLVESPADVINMLDAYSATTGGVMPTPGSALVTGYDFLADAAADIQAELEAGIGGGTDALIAARDLSPLDPAVWTADDLRAVLLGAPHDVIFLAGHFSASSALAADYDTRMLASELAASGVDLENALIFSAGCHSGYNIVNEHGVPGVTVEPDWAQAFAQKGATFIGGTGYQYGDTDFLEYSERLYLMFSQQLRYGSGPVPVGDALVAAKQHYLATTPQLRGIHEKALLEATLFGLPMLSVDMPHGRVTPSDPSSIVSSTTGYTTDPGQELGLAYADVTLSLTLSERTVTLHSVTNYDDTTDATYLEGSDGIVVNPAEPVLPLEMPNVSVSGTVLRGVGFRGGGYADHSGITPLTGAAATEIRGVHPPFLSDVFFPVQPWGVNYFDLLANPVTGLTRLAVIPAQFRSDAPDGNGTLRLFGDMSFRLFYSSNVSNYGGNVPALAAPPAITKVLAESNSPVITFKVYVLGDPAAGIQEVWVTYTGVSGDLAGSWQSLDLTQTIADSTLWTGQLDLAGVGTPPEDLRFMVQAVNGVGLVALVTNQGEYFVPDIDPGQPSAGVDPASLETAILSLESSPTSGVYNAPLTFRASLSDTHGGPISGQTVTFALGPQRRRATTNSNGVAEVEISPLGVPGPSELRASFAGNSTYWGSSASKLSTIYRQDTQLELVPDEVTVEVGADPHVTAILRDGLDRRLPQKTVFFVVSGAGGSHSVSDVANFIGQASLGPVPLPLGTYEITAYFSGEIPLPGGTIELTDPNYEPAKPVTGTLTIEESSAGDTYVIYLPLIFK